MKKIDDFTVNPNVIWMLPPEPLDENEPVSLTQALTPRCPDLRIEAGSWYASAGKMSFPLKSAEQLMRSAPISATRAGRAS